MASPPWFWRQAGPQQPLRAPTQVLGDLRASHGPQSPLHPPQLDLGDPSRASLFLWQHLGSGSEASMGGMKASACLPSPTGTWRESSFSLGKGTCKGLLLLQAHRPLSLLYNLYSLSGFLRSFFLSASLSFSTLSFYVSVDT